MALTFLYLSGDDIRALALSPSVLADAIASAFRERHDGNVILPVKTDMRPTGGDAFFHAMPSAIAGREAGIKWVAGAAGNDARGLPHIMGLLVLSDISTGAPRAVMDARELTGQRTAAVSLLAARFLARRNSSEITFVGCGFQARTHLAALAAEFPLRRVRALSRRQESAADFCCHAAELDLEARPSTDAEAAVSEADIIVSTVPAGPELKPILDGRWLKAGAFVSMVDLGRSWLAEGMTGFDRIVTDDREQTLALAARNPLFERVRFASDLGDLVAETAPGRTSESERVGFLFPGTAIADLAAGALALDRAIERGIGRSLPL